MSDYLDRLEHQYEEAEESIIDPKFNLHPYQREVLERHLKKLETHTPVYLCGSGHIVYIEKE